MSLNKRRNWRFCRPGDKILRIAFVCMVVNLCCSSCATLAVYQAKSMLKVDSIEELDDLASFHFIIMSDNKGDSPDTNALFARMVNWTQESGATFAIGLGDHVWRLRPENQFVKFVNSNDWWNSHFYPNIADGENGFYGKNQADWGTGGKLFDELELQNRSNIVIRDNNCEYYALLHVGDYTIHLIQLHYPDEPYDPIVAFKEDSRNYLMETLANI